MLFFLPPFGFEFKFEFEFEFEDIERKASTFRSLPRLEIGWVFPKGLDDVAAAGAAVFAVFAVLFAANWA